MEIGEINSRWIVIVGSTLYMHINSACHFGGICGGDCNQPDLASLIVALAISMAVASEDRWLLISCEGASRPPCALVLVYETLLSIIIMCAIMQWLWYPIVPYLCNFGDLFSLFGMECFGYYLTTNEGIGHLKILVALGVLVLEIFLINRRKKRLYNNCDGCNTTSQNFCYSSENTGTCWDEFAEDQATSTTGSQIEQINSETQNQEDRK